MVVIVATTAFALIFAWARVRRHYPLAASEATPVEPQGQWRVVLPFVMLAGLSFINGRADVIMLGAIATPDEVGLYRVAFQGAQLVGFPLLAIGSAFAPEVARLGRDAGRDALSRLMGMGAMLTGLGALIAFLGALLLGRWGIALVLGEFYIPAWAPMMVLAAGHLVSGIFGPVGLLLDMQGHEKRTLAAGMIAAIANVALNALLIPRYGMMGAAFATSASLIGWNLALGISLRRAAGVLPGPLALLEVGRATR